MLSLGFAFSKFSNNFASSYCIISIPGRIKCKCNANSVRYGNFEKHLKIAEILIKSFMLFQSIRSSSFFPFSFSLSLYLSPYNFSVGKNTRICLRKNKGIATMREKYRRKISMDLPWTNRENERNIRL